MGMNLKGGDEDSLGEMSEINVTPFIDVMLVLLIIFMVAAPLSTVDVPVDLPVSNAPPQERPDEPIFLTVQQDLSLTLGEEPVTAQALSAALDGLTGGNREERVFLRADGAVAYADLMNVMNDLRDAGYLRIGLVGAEDPAAAVAAAEARAAQGPGAATAATAAAPAQVPAQVPARAPATP